MLSGLNVAAALPRADNSAAEEPHALEASPLGTVFLETDLLDSGASLEAIAQPQALPVAGIELIKQFSVRPQAAEAASSGPLKQAEATEALCMCLRTVLLPVLTELPCWHTLNEHQQGALLSFSESLGKDLAAVSPRSLLGRALRDRCWYKVANIIRGYRGHGTSPDIDARREAEAALFELDVCREQYTLINRARRLELVKPLLSGQDVRTLQTALVRQGYEIELDGCFGPITQWAVEKFQQSVKLPITGVADMKTQRVLYARDLYFHKANLIGSDVREVQSLLSRIGYDVPINGIFNLRTCRAVLAFQKYFGLPEDGIVRGQTLTQLLYLPAIA